MRCGVCGREVEAGGNYCPNCGSPIETPRSDQAPGIVKRNLAIEVLVAAVIIVAVLVAVTVIPSSDDDDTWITDNIQVSGGLADGTLDVYIEDRWMVVVMNDVYGYDVPFADWRLTYEGETIDEWTQFGYATRIDLDLEPGVYTLDVTFGSKSASGGFTVYAEPASG